MLRRTVQFAIFVICAFAFFVLASANSCFAQSNNLGNPPIKNFTKQDYHAGTQNWQIAQDKRGVVYAANNKGLLEFDGNHWRLYPLPSGTILRSFAIADDGKIYVGGQGEIGYFMGNEQGVLTFNSLNEFLPKEHQVFADVWNIIIDKGAVYFMAWQMIAKWVDEEMRISLSGEGYIFMDKIGDRFFIHKANGAFGYCENYLTAPFKQIAEWDAKVTSISAYNPDSLIITTEDGNIFQLNNTTVSPWAIPDDPFFQNNIIYCAALLPNNQIVFGSTAKGLVILDKNRRILHKINKTNDLQNNTVLSAFANINGNIWLGLDNGITFIHANSALTEFFPDGYLEGTCYSTVIHEGQLYTAANTGIYKIPWKKYYPPEEKTTFTKVKNSGGQVWSLGLHRGMLFAGHQRGAFIVEKDRARQVSDLFGVWRYIAIEDDLLIAGHYGGLALFKQQSNNISYIGNLDGLNESCRLLGYDNGSVWMAHPYRGIFKNEILIDKKAVSSTHYDSQNGLPSNFNNHLFQLSNKTVFTGEKGVFRYESSQNAFIPDKGFNEIFGKDTQIKYLRQDKKGNIWYAADEEVGVLWIKDMTIDKSIEKMVIPELTDKLHSEFEYILPIDDNNVLFTTEKGVTHFDPTKYHTSKEPPTVVLSEVWLKGRQDSLLFGGYYQNNNQTTTPVLTYQQNALNFVFSSTDHEGMEFAQYSHFIDGMEQEWSAWSKQTSLSINNLQPGNYKLFLKAKNKLGIESEPISFAFTIHPPWYASTIAKTIYGLLFIGTFIGLAFFQNRRHEKEKAVIETTYLKEQEKKEALVQESKAKINQLERQKLETEVQYKNQELAAATMNLLQKSEMLTSIQSSLEKLKKQDIDKNEINAEIKRLLKMVKKENDLSDEWERFSKHFDQVHSDFLKKLNEAYPNLSPNDFKLSAYLRMNLSTKEIASLMNISIRGVEASRYRLRKRMELDKAINLTEFLMKM